MRRHGSITRWIDDRGFGFVTDDEKGEEAFLHVSELRRRSIRPQVGDRVSFDIELDERGRPQAVRVAHAQGAVFAHVVPEGEDDVRGSGRRGARPGVMTWIVAVLAIGLGFGWFLTRPPARDSYSAPAEPAPFAAARARVVPSPHVDTLPVSSPYRCEGKTRCSQMSSCDEAIFYLHHCPGSITDGDNDGKPCEDQWCGH